MDNLTSAMRGLLRQDMTPEARRLIELAMEAQSTGRMPSLDLLAFDFPFAGDDTVPDPLTKILDKVAASGMTAAEFDAVLKRSTTHTQQ